MQRAQAGKASYPSIAPIDQSTRARRRADKKRWGSHFRIWHIATFRCDAELGRYRGHSGHRASRTKAQFYEYAPSKV